jgi:hypothetical protein
VKKILLVGAIVIVLALSGIGAAYATGMGLSGVNALSLGTGAVPQINCTGVAYCLSSSAGVGVQVDAVKIKFGSAVENAAISVSLRDASNNELC